MADMDDTDARIELLPDDSDTLKALTPANPLAVGLPSTVGGHSANSHAFSERFGVQPDSLSGQGGSHFGDRSDLHHLQSRFGLLLHNSDTLKPLTLSAAGDLSDTAIAFSFGSQ